MDKKLCIATILGAHGIRGLVKLRIHLEEPETLTNYNPLEDSQGKHYTITLKNPVKGDWLAEIEGISDRNASELLARAELFIDRDKLPALEEGQLYLEDIVGCDAINPEGHKIGDVIAVENFGASDLLEIRPLNGAKTFYVPITEQFVLDIDMEERVVMIDPAQEFMD